MKCTIKLLWDNESNSWYTETNDIPGMVLDSNSFDALLEKVRLIAPDMLELNCNYVGPITFTFITEHTETIRDTMSVQSTNRNTANGTLKQAGINHRF